MQSVTLDSQEFGYMHFVNSSSTSASGRFIMQTKDTKMLDFDINKRVLTITFESLNHLKKFEGANAVGFTLKDWKQKKATYYSGIHIKVIPKIKEPSLNLIRQGELSKFNFSRDATPIILRIEDITRNGLMFIKFNQELIVPGFVDKTNSSRNESQESMGRELIKLKDIDVRKEIMDLQLEFNNEFDEINMDFNFSIVDWTSDGMQVQVNFSDPLLISQGRVLDKIIVKIMDKDKFRSQKNGNTLMSDRVYLQKPIKKQLPAGVSEEEIKKKAKTAAFSMGALMIVEAFLQICLKGILTDLWVLFFTLQIICYLQIYDVPLPANTVIYVDEITKVIEFDLLNPDTIGKIATGNSHFKTIEFLQGKYGNAFDDQ